MDQAPAKRPLKNYTAAVITAHFVACLGTGLAFVVVIFIMDKGWSGDIAGLIKLLIFTPFIVGLVGGILGIPITLTGWLVGLRFYYKGETRRRVWCLLGLCSALFVSIFYAFYGWKFFITFLLFGGLIGGWYVSYRLKTLENTIPDST